MSYQRASIIIRALPPPSRRGRLPIWFLLPIAMVIACLTATNASAAAAAAAVQPGPVFDFKAHPPGTYTLYKIKTAADGRVLDTAGKPRALSDFLGGGKVTLLSFIYSTCADPNGCPYAYAVFHYLKNRLQRERPADADKVRLVSLSFDPVRDTPEMLRLYAGENVKARDGVEWNFLTTSSLADLVPILDAYGQDVYIDLDPKTQQPLSTMSHVLKVFLIDRHGIIREIYTASYLQPEVAYNDILTLLLEGGVIQQ